MFTKAVEMLNVPGTPLPWGQETGEVPVEQPPYDATSDKGEAPLGTIPSDEFVPVLQTINLDDLENHLTPPPTQVSIWPDAEYYD
jgi:hypothetical protein